MKFNWKVVLLFVLILAFIVPVYSKAVETGKEVPKSPELLDDKSSTLKNVNTPKNLKASPLTIPANSTIADLFPDEGMAKTVANQLGRTENNNFQTPTKTDWKVDDVVTEVELNRMWYLTSVATIGSIEGIQYLPNLYDVRLQFDNQCKDLSPFLKAPNGYSQLYRLAINNGNISDISPLTELSAPTLNDIDLGGNNISDLSLFPKLPNKLPNLEEISLERNNISDVSPLADFASTKIKVFNLDENHITDLSSLTNNKMPNLQRLYVRYQTLDMEPVVTSSKYEFSIQPSIFGTTKPVKITATKPKATIDPITSKITYSAEEMAKKPFYYSPLFPGVTYSWDENFPLNGSNSLVDFRGTITQPLTYIEPPQVVSYNSGLTYEIGTSLTEQQFLNDVNLITDQPTTITSDFDVKLKNLNTVGIYWVAVKASNIEGNAEANIMVTIKYKPPVITADAEYTYLVGDKVNATQFRADVNATLTGEGTLRDDFIYKVRLNTAGDYVVTLTSPKSGYYEQDAIPVTVIVHVKELLELQIPDEFRMDIDANADSVPISDKKQTLKCYGSSGKAELEVIDRRTVRQGWTITGAMTPFTNSGGDILQTSLKYQSKSPSSSPIYLNTTNQPIEKKQSAVTDPKYDSTVFNLEDSLSMEIEPNDALVNDSYESKITWTLEDAPRP
ncbi:TPA_asm: lmo0549 family WxL domain-containing class 2 internalin [Listeria monocytogenes]|uniref:lmo0549 family WxL domain-containing class 2 internalin n=1 Tax=Listeria monocytogenes TaxID=1639 RepID=UPI00086D00F1|nr:lmo0549 family WxL domain-containing class 2 internalin [Listeria monocytogenes]EAE7386368.1 lmo0549 family WxL domain-containing class 2 internalin [Listeria monocytogenes]EAF2342432.1 lmo0549 family WxL domain-containing class 2 internalin [Listeria monocytogenes]EAF6952600.1 lmo0549 family WxL domain-containing class 2 internalin [Listeria monocytogenes]EAG6823723.1 lmo0549 family WxL domain-containing class 2 internalin [Listeria monocytogenes]EAW7056897.1 lmo0549 family WxL domain-cont